ncbi:MAG TPA: transcription-repair coupling factor [Bacteroidia bacterium]|nr:transcription-repair coupling factor [Bacteroidia bacterium]
MSDPSNIVNHFAAHPDYSELLRAFSNQHKDVIHLNGLTGSAPAFWFLSIQEQYPHSAVIILKDKDEASYFFNDLENISDPGRFLFFPSSFKKSFRSDLPDNDAVLQRAESLTRIGKFVSNPVIVTYAEALAEKVVTLKNLNSHTFEVRRNDNLGIEFLTEFLGEHGFERSDFVYEAGQFAVRGGIVDVYSFANELPYRFEFFGNTIESIRSFDPMTQLSEKNYEHVIIIPNVQQSMLQNESETFFDFISKNSVFWFSDASFVLEFVRENNDDKEWSREQISHTRLSKEELYIRSEQVQSKMEEFKRVEFGSQKMWPAVFSLSANTTPQPLFNKNFDMLLGHLVDNNKSKIDTYIFADQAKQIERIYAILEDVAAREKIPTDLIRFTPVLKGIHQGFFDTQLNLAFYTDHQIFNRYHRYRQRKSFSRNQAITVKELSRLQPGDFVTHIDHGIGKFAGMHRIEVNGKWKEAIKLIYKDNDILFISIHALHRISRFTSGEGKTPALSKLGSNSWNRLKQKTKNKVQDIARDLIELYAKRRAQKGFAFTPDTYLQNELEASFIYEDTPDQEKSSNDVKSDMEKEYPMDRLICGDVGFGKTEVAIRAAFKAATDGKQVAILVPTTILALQHYNTFRERLSDFPVRVDYINRFKSSAQQKKVLKDLIEGRVDILIGTHRLLSKDVKFRDLGLLIIDEEQKFGVGAKEKLKALRANVDTLVLTATPIPRTLQFSLMGARDLSIINTPPPNRYPVTTEVHAFNEQIVQDAILYETGRGGQVFFVHNRIQNIHDIADMIQSLCPGVSVGIGHGQMDSHQLENILLDFIEGDLDVLVSTTIIESGLDISNANTIIINQAQNFGLSDLHQMRGRVGRSNKKAFCYLLTPPFSVLTQDARQRLKAIEELSDLGSGFQVAMRDLDIRGAGNLLGAEQSGFIAEIGFETYHKILDEAVAELRDTEYKELFQDQNAEKEYVRDCQMDTDLDVYIPDYYVENLGERLALYKQLDDLENEEDLLKFSEGLEDRFGKLPKQVMELFDALRLRWIASRLGFEKITLKQNRLKAQFLSNKQSNYFESNSFKSILSYVSTHAKKCTLKEEKEKLFLLIKNVEGIRSAMHIFNVMQSEEYSELANKTHDES